MEEMNIGWSFILFFENGFFTGGFDDKNSLFRQAIKVALACWDCVRGNEVCACYPSSYMNDKSFMNRILSHSIWFLEDNLGDEFLDERIDVEFQGQVLSAFYIDLTPAPAEEHCTQRFLLFIESPIDQSLLVDQIHPILKRRLNEELGEGLPALLEKKRLASSKIRRPNYQEKIKKGEEVEEKLVRIWEEVIKDNLNNRARTSELKDQDLDVPAPRGTSSEEDTDREADSKKPALIQRVKFFTPETVEISLDLPSEGDICHVVIKNSLKDLDNVTIRVSQVSEFFSENVFSEAIGTFQLMEQLMFEIPRENENRSYIIEVRSGKKKIKMHQVDIPAIIAAQ
ncbi:MAG: hypothetical protein ACFFD4_03100 [Candidatus Odinarchaeota archaeon]